MADFKKSVVYQIYPKSFYDSNHDGLGDLRGVIEKLDYIRELGVDYIWLTPFFVSPQKDNGYDVEDYYRIDPRYGTMDDFEELVREADRRGIRLMLDMVFNHTSSRHEWFRKALAGNEKYKNYYIFRKGREGGEAPTNWESKFGGGAWEYVPEMDEFYLHLFDVSQPDLNWDNEEVRAEIRKILLFWMGKGVKGFRFDVVNLISKGEFADDTEGDGRRFYTDGPNIHRYLKELNELTFGKDAEIVTVGEMSSTSMENCFQYAGEDSGELSMVFSFHHLKVDFMGNEKWVLVPADFMKLKKILFGWQEGMEKQTGEIVVNRITQNTITKTHTHTPLKAVDFGFRTKKKGQAYNASIQSRKSQRLYNHAKHPLTQPPVIPAGKRIALSNALIAPGMEFYSARVSLYQQREVRRYYNDYTRIGAGRIYYP